ncbi:MAG TPA: 6,7-dimethyl-8-ribityllumazine synthase [Phycisphaerae bacterium]|jgi:6,7-dimethyl-8-ribityllumazine synthase|nr:6,7-dimethyl-8-ribityllumazine synthase [Phycisphaerae bacterium]
METVTGDLFVKPGNRFALVVAEFNSFITMQLAEGAVQCLLRHGAKAEQITQILVPGAFEIPTVAKAAAKSNKYAAVICIACVIRGATDHYDHVAGQVARGVGAIGPETGVPTVFGVITADNQEQALDRAGLKMGNAGWNAALAAISTASVLAKIKAAE